MLQHEVYIYPESLWILNNLSFSILLMNNSVSTGCFKPEILSFPSRVLGELFYTFFFRNAFDYLLACLNLFFSKLFAFACFLGCIFGFVSKSFFAQGFKSQNTMPESFYKGSINLGCCPTVRRIKPSGPWGLPVAGRL